MGRFDFETRRRQSAECAGRKSTPVPTIVTEFTLAPPNLAVTQDKPGVATVRSYIVNNGDHDLNTTIASTSIPVGLEYTATGGHRTVRKGEFAEVDLTFTTAGLEAKEHRIELAVTGNTAYTLPRTQILTTLLTINAPAVGSKSAIPSTKKLNLALQLEEARP